MAANPQLFLSGFLLFLVCCLCIYVVAGTGRIGWWKLNHTWDAKWPSGVMSQFLPRRRLETASRWQRGPAAVKRSHFCCYSGWVWLALSFIWLLCAASHMSHGKEAAQSRVDVSRYWMKIKVSRWILLNSFQATHVLYENIKDLLKQVNSPSSPASCFLEWPTNCL